MQILLLGPPGAGKGTQAKLLAERLNLLHLSTGDVLRQNVANKTALGMEALPYMESGKYVPDDLINRMVEDQLDSPAAAEGVIFDGYPRTLNQAETLDALLERKGRPIAAVIVLDITDDELVERLSGRRVCSGCGAIYQLKSMPPLKPDTCDHCGAALYQRVDDNEETVRTRLKVYAEQTSPLVEYYTAQRKVRHVDASQGIEKTFERVMALLGGEG